MAQVTTKATAQQNDSTFSQLVTQGSAHDNHVFSIDTNDVAADSALPLSPPEQDPKKREQDQLDALTQGVADLLGYHHRQATALSSTLADTIVTSTLAPMTGALNSIKGGIDQITHIFKEAKTFSVTQQLAQSAHGLIAEVKQHLATFAVEAENFKGPLAQRAAENARNLSGVLSELSQSASLDPAQGQLKQPEFPLGSVFVTPPSYDQKMFVSIDAIGETFQSEQHFSRAWADALTAQRQEQFAKLALQSKDSPLDIEKPRKVLQGESIVSHLEKANSELIASISDAKVALAAKDREHTSAHETAETIAAEVQNLHDAHGVVSSQIQDQEAAIKHLQDVSAPDTGNAPAAQAQSDKKPGVLARVKSVAARFMRGRQTAEEANDQRDTVSPSSQNSEELKNLQHTLTELTAKKVDIGDQFGIEKNNLLSAIALRNSIGEAINQIHAKVSTAKEVLQNTLRRSCEGLHFTTPSNTQNPVTEALLAISIPATKDPIPSIDSVLDKEYLQDLGAKLEEKDGGVSLTHQATGTSITIEKRSSHGFDATLTVTDADRKQVASDRIWNDDLKKLVDHFLRTGNAPVREKQVQSWKVVDEATAPENGRSDHPSLGVSARAAKLVGFLKDALTAEGYDIKAPQSSEALNIVSNKLDIAHSVNEVAKRVTALLDKDTFKWSLFIEGAQQVALTTLDALAKVVDYLSKEPVEPKAEPDTGEQPERAQSQVVSAEESPSQSVTNEEPTSLEQLRDTLAQKYIGTKLRLSESGDRTSGKITDISVTPPTQDGSVTGHWVELKVQVKGRADPESWGFRADTDDLNLLIEERAPTIRSHVGKFRFTGRSSAQPAAEPNQDPAAPVEQSKRNTARDQLAAEIYSAWQSAERPAKWEYSLKENVLIEVERIADDKFVTSLILNTRRVAHRTSDKLAQSLQILVGAYMKDYEPKAMPGNVSRWESPENQGHQPSTSYAEWQKAVQEDREMKVKAEQSQDPKQDQGPVHRH